MFKKLKNQEKKVKSSIKFIARSELLLPEESGYLEPDHNEETYQITQKEIVDAVDIATAKKYFRLDLDYGPYKLDYFRNGRNLLIGGRRGHVAAIDWVTKDLLCEFNVQESVHAVKWLHMPTMFAVAQKDWVHIYDNKGTQLHCLKKLYRVCHLDFLPYHFLLVSASDNGFLSWLDVSIGQMIANFKTKKTNITSMKQNPYNGVVATSHPNGTVCLWSPNQQEPLVNMLCHETGVRDLAFDSHGQYLATIGADRKFRIWDARNYKCLKNYKLSHIPNNVEISQQNLTSISMGKVVEIYNNCFTQDVESPYLRHRFNSAISAVKFCNYEDILGVGQETGFTSLIIPGAGEPNFDAFESNPFMTKSQRREMEVKSLLDKIQPELITLDPNELLKVNVSAFQSKVQERKIIKDANWNNMTKEQKLNFKKRRKSAKKVKIVKMLKEQAKREEIKESIRSKKKDDKKKKDNKKESKKRVKFDKNVKKIKKLKGVKSEKKVKHVLDRFKLKS